MKTIRIYQHIFRFDVPVDKTIRMHISNSLAHLPNNVSDFFIIKISIASLFYLFVESYQITRQILKHQICVHIVPEEIQQFYYVRMMQSWKSLNLSV